MNQPRDGKPQTRRILDTPLRLRSGLVLRNRVVKAAMEEQLAGPRRQPDHRLVTLYRRLADGGAGLLITGHVMIERRAVAQPGDIVLDEASDLDAFRRWSAAAGTLPVFMQLNHPGRVVRRDTGSIAYAPSPVPVQAGGLSGLFAPPVEMTASDIARTIGQFAASARLARESGFAGVEIHAAHGYLLSQFLSPLVNNRTDEWGGALRQRARLLLRVVDAVRDSVPDSFPVAVKLNSADFQRGGFDIDDAAEVIDWLSPAVDLVELSGGSIESLATAGHPADNRTLARESYFLDLATRLVGRTATPLMLTGGIRRGHVAENVLRQGFALAGVGTAYAQNPRAVRQWLDGHDAPVAPPTTWIRSKALRAAAVQAAVTDRLHTGACDRRRPRMPTGAALLADQIRRARQLRHYRKEQDEAV
ncbi:2,4-dienoyl-CoA reductase [Nocardiopsis tropica]|uniref:2,4-dienoyl-CoA reductase n=1 Tax=Nocardiopsis tropica TaxID=109330 RepID=A0ABV1ZNV5_9ACTN